MNFMFKHFFDLTLDELYDILQLRAEIFVVEQTCIYNDIDGLDKNAVHLFVKNNQGEIVGCSRLLKPGTRFPGFSIGRVVVKKTSRGTGIGKKMMEEAIKFILNNWGAESIKVSAQKYLQRFYGNLGFDAVTPEYLEDGIPHVGMEFKKQP